MFYADVAYQRNCYIRVTYYEARCHFRIETETQRNFKPKWMDDLSGLFGALVLAGRYEGCDHSVSTSRFGVMDSFFLFLFIFLFATLL